MKRILIVVGSLIAAVVLMAAGCLFVLGLALNVLFDPPVAQPKFGFAGNWRRQGVFGVEERPLPPALEIWHDYESWKPATNEHSSRFYLARLGRAHRQSDFESWTNMTHNMPLGDYKYTRVRFTYHDETRGDYVLTWNLRGKHNVDFLRLDDRERFYQLEFYGSPEEYPPMLEIVAIEGVKPW